MTDEDSTPRIATFLGLAAIEDRYGEDYYARTDAWAEGRPDLGENA